MTKEEAEKKSKEMQTIIGTPYESIPTKKVFYVTRVTPLTDPLKPNEYNIYIAFENQDDKKPLIEPMDIFFNHYQEHNP